MNPSALILWLALAAPAAGQGLGAQIDSLLEGLGDIDYSKREQASSRLWAFAQRHEASWELRRALRDRMREQPDPEVRYRLVRTVEALPRFLITLKIFPATRNSQDGGQERFFKRRLTVVNLSDLPLWYEARPNRLEDSIYPCFWLKSTLSWGETSYSSYSQAPFRPLAYGQAPEGGAAKQLDPGEALHWDSELTAWVLEHYPQAEAVTMTLAFQAAADLPIYSWNGKAFEPESPDWPEKSRSSLVRFKGWARIPLVPRPH